MSGQNGSVFIRIPFDHVPDPDANLNFMTLRVRYDDGFVAYIHGQRVASANAPAVLDPDAVATTTNDDSAAIQWRDFNVSAAIGDLETGPNLLAIHGLNVSAGSSDFLFDAELEVGERQIDEGGALVYSGPIVLNDLARVSARVLNGNEWSALVETTFLVGEPRLVISELDYHPMDPSAGEIAAGFDDADDFRVRPNSTILPP